MSITVYGSPICVPCKRTKAYLERFNTPYDYVDVTTDASALSTISSLGYSSVPVVVSDVGHHSGFKPMLLAELV